jgi:hypothetical protein
MQDAALRLLLMDLGSAGCVRMDQQGMGSKMSYPATLVAVTQLLQGAKISPSCVSFNRGVKVQCGPGALFRILFGP